MKPISDSNNLNLKVFNQINTAAKTVWNEVCYRQYLTYKSEKAIWLADRICVLSPVIIWWCWNVVNIVKLALLMNDTIILGFWGLKFLSQFHRTNIDRSNSLSVTTTRKPWTKMLIVQDALKGKHLPEVTKNTLWIPEFLLTFMLLIGWIVNSDWDQDKEDEQWPDDLDQQLNLKKGDKDKEKSRSQ